MNKKCTVFITEDDHDDASFLKQALIDSSFNGNIEHLDNGRLLLDKLNDSKQKKSLPELIILDLNMPLKGGLEVLSVMNADPEYKSIPVAVVTASLNNEDEVRCKRLGCDLFRKKPVRLSDYQIIATDIVTLLRSRFAHC